MHQLSPHSTDGSAARPSAEPFASALRCLLEEAPIGCTQGGGGVAADREAALARVTTTLVGRFSLIEALVRLRHHPLAESRPQHGVELNERGSVPHRIPQCFFGVGPRPDLPIIRRAGDRAAVAVERNQRPGARLAGQLGLAAWCAWATADSEVALMRAERATNHDTNDMFALILVRWLSLDIRPVWLPDAVGHRSVPGSTNAARMLP
ncbi:hypothetical protein [Curtobacterium ammoniigenes]|uniref:hypothetical protein n=1 Tax=Curtobacterium ammoniigenes TaxID=395387 RepID=UPI00082D19E3|nr:hypothetical protein [Curtobacterium ammoniigenes]